MPTLQSHRGATTHSKRSRARGPVVRTPSRKRAGSPDAWITDPKALLLAISNAERAERVAAEEAARGVLPLEPLPPPIEPEPVDRLPTLRDDERLAHAPHEGVIVIIRRRRAA
jgi:hypothetical protein